MDGTEYITLKEAGEISGYSPDYVGQLIRRGKLTGKQVYANVAWVTTKDALKDYLSEKGKVIKSEKTEYQEEAKEESILNIENAAHTTPAQPISVGAHVALSPVQEVEQWERFFRAVSIAIIIIASLFLVFLLHVFSTLLDDVSERHALERVSMHTASPTI